MLGTIAFFIGLVAVAIVSLGLAIVGVMIAIKLAVMVFYLLFQFWYVFLAIAVLLVLLIFYLDGTLLFALGVISAIALSLLAIGFIGVWIEEKQKKQCSTQ